MELYYFLYLTSLALALATHNITSSSFLPRTVNAAVEWEKAWCKGSLLVLAMINPPSQGSTYLSPLHSPWDGTLHSEFATWGYNERPGYRDELCDFGPTQHGLQRAFEDLGIDTRSKGMGGANECFHVEHQDGVAVERPPGGGWPEPARQFYVVNRVRYRVTQAYTTLGINPISGALFFLNRLSPAAAAAETWNLPDPKSVRKEWLPALSATSDHAWGFWSRVNHGRLGNIRKVFSCMITNEVTLALIDEALRTFPLGPGQERPRGVEKWPGTTWPVRYDAAQALIGSPNGQAAAYFLAQHKRQLGGNKVIDRVTVFRPDRGIMPYLLFWVEDAPNGPHTFTVETGAWDARDDLEPRMVKQSADGRNVEREYQVWD